MKTLVAAIAYLCDPRKEAAWEDLDATTRGAINLVLIGGFLAACVIIALVGGF